MGGQLLPELDGGELIALFAVMGALTVGLVVAVTAVVMSSWQKVRERQMATSIVLEMLNRGMSADDIAQVLRAAEMEKHTDQIPAAKSPHAASPRSVA